MAVHTTKFIASGQIAVYKFNGGIRPNDQILVPW